MKTNQITMGTQYQTRIRGISIPPQKSELDQPSTTAR